MRLATLAAFALLATPALASDDRPATAEEAARVNAVLASIGCAAATKIEVDDDGSFEIDDVACTSPVLAGTYDIELGADLMLEKLERE